MASDDEPTPGKRSRLEREVEEILAKSGGLEERRHQRGAITHLKPRSRPRPRTPRSWPALDRLPRLGHVSNGALALLGCLIAAVLAVLVHGFSPLLANIFALLSVALLLAPIIFQFRRPGGRESKMWRGRPIDFRDDDGPNIIEQIRDRFFRPK
jgi:hypothetical protein